MYLGSEKKQIQTGVWSLLFLSIFLYFVYPVMFFFFVEGWGWGGAFLLIIIPRVGHSLIWPMRVCAAEQGMVFKVLSLKQGIRFHY